MLKTWVEQNQLVVILALIGVVLIGSGVFWFETSREAKTQVEILSATTDQNSTNTIYVDISGAVNQPGVYQLPVGSRVEDALRVAGGLTEGAWTEWIETNLNRAKVLGDGTKIYIPAVGETTPASMKTSSEKIGLNSATKSELELLPGVGPVTAEKIITNRPYQSIQELLTKKVVGQKIFDQIQDLVSLW